MPKVVLYPQTFYSPGDEYAFFKWVEKIKSIKRCEGLGNTCVLHFSSKTISHGDLREIIALFVRYQFKDSSQLSQFRMKKNQLRDPRIFWQARISKNLPLRPSPHKDHFQEKLDRHSHALIIAPKH